MTKIVANIVGKNEEAHYLKPMLERVAKQVDLITFTDDCSDDDTAHIAKICGARVFKMPQPTFNTHEGRLRQASWMHLETQITQDEPWWVLAIDCDEMLYEHGNTLRNISDMEQYDVANVTFFHMWNEDHFRIDKAWAPHPSTRFFRHFPGGQFADRQLACGSEPIYVSQLARTSKYNFESGLVMQHLSYIKDEDKQAKYDRYAKIDGGAFHANAHIESILDKDPTLSKWEL